jgi:predicted transcriptional regulator
MLHVGVSVILRFPQGPLTQPQVSVAPSAIDKRKFRRKRSPKQEQKAAFIELYLSSRRGTEAIVGWD